IMSNQSIKNNQFFRNVVRERDNWTCQKCGSIEYVQAHHIDAVKDYPLFANLPDNGITLCVYCHADAHPEIPRGLFIANVIKAKKEGCISAGKLAKELNVNPRTIVRKAVKLGILKPMQNGYSLKKKQKLLNPIKR
ncbi:MAG: HNH endonuclease, partial [Patescibacteria group bacterium]